MPTSIRLDPATEAQLVRLAARRGQTKSDVIRDAIARLAAEDAGGPDDETPFSRIAHLAGVADSGGARLSEQTGRRFRDLLVAKKRARRTG